MSKKTWMAGLVVAVVAVFGLATTSMGQDKKAPINTKCPVSGKAVDASKTSEVTVKFCCENCQGKFEKDPTACIAKVDKLPNEKCPVSGKAVAAAHSTVLVAFCCGDCKGKFDADPSKCIKNVKHEAAK